MGRAKQLRERARVLALALATVLAFVASATRPPAWSLRIASTVARLDARSAGEGRGEVATAPELHRRAPIARAAHRDPGRDPGADGAPRVWLGSTSAVAERDTLAGEALTSRPRGALLRPRPATHVELMVFLN